MSGRLVLSLLAVLLGPACTAPPAAPMRARLGAEAEGLEALARAFERANPGYTLAWWPPGSGHVPAEDRDRVLFVQGAAGEIRFGMASSAVPDPRAVAPGDLVLLPAGTALRVGGGPGLLAFGLPQALPPGLPPVIRPDHDPRITDTPGGCAEDDEAYRRLLLTWRPERGPYVFHGLNAHRVRIQDSFSHYHPSAGGFDEFYLVQAAAAGSRLITSVRVPEIEREVLPEDPASLLQVQPVAAGELYYLPRGTLHRGLGDLVVQVIAVPGFRPGAEIGLDHHLRRISEALAARGRPPLPYHEAASLAEVVK